MTKSEENNCLKVDEIVQGQKERPKKRKPYNTPVLTCYGSLRELTASGSNGPSETMTMTGLERKV